MPCQYVNLNIDGILTKKKITVGCEYTNKDTKTSWKMKNERTKKWKENYCRGSVHYFMNDKKEEEKPRKLHRRVYGCVCVCAWSGED